MRASTNNWLTWLRGKPSLEAYLGPLASRIAECAQKVRAYGTEQELRDWGTARNWKRFGAALVGQSYAPVAATRSTQHITPKFVCRFLLE